LFGFVSGNRPLLIALRRRMAMNGVRQCNPVVVVHGGAWNIPDQLLERSRNGAKASARGAYQILKTGGSALDAVVAAVRVLEDDVNFDAGM
jgi:isoaspartyl peptidase/L-asparaginase-like protein (Ntn-hydrolase superfamily)